MKNARAMKAVNRLAVLCLLRRHCLSRSELAAATGLTRAAMSFTAAGIAAEKFFQGRVQPEQLGTPKP